MSTIMPGDSLEGLTLEGDEWVLHLASWVIQDGSYPDLSVGDRLRHAVALEPAPPQLKWPPDPPIERGLWRDGALYRASGEVVFTRGGRVAVVDFGSIPTYTTERTWIRPRGSPVRGIAVLAIDADQYREAFVRIRGMPRIEYEWVVNAIFRQPREGERATHVANGRAYMAVARTDAFADSGLEEYLVVERRAARL
jgi:hypothetical protein